MGWMIEERRLDDFQVSVLQQCGNLTVRNHWIQGFAGSGKSVLLVHIVQRLLAEKPNLKPCVAVFTHALKDMINTGFKEEFELNVKVITYHKFLYDEIKYDFVAVDEVQDIPRDKLQKIKGLAKHIVVAGDNEQSIYDGSSTAKEIAKILDPEIHPLVTIYRLTETIKNIVKTILPNSQIENAPVSRKPEVKVTLAKAEGEYEEIKWVWKQCRRRAVAQDPAVIILPNHVEIQNFIKKICIIEDLDPPIFPEEKTKYGIKTNYEPTNELFENSGRPLQYLGNTYGELSDSNNRALTYLMTYHSAKGLDFETVFLPKLDNNQPIFGRPDLDSRLFFVAMTRSRKNLFLSHSTEDPIHYVANFPQDLLHKITCNDDNEPELPF